MSISAPTSTTASTVIATGTLNSSGSYIFVNSDTSPSMHVNGDMVVAGGITVNGKLTTLNGALEDRMSKIEERLAILHPNKSIEAKFEELRLAGEHYRRLEADFKEQLEIEKMLKS